jgi:hypothetical protein
MPIRPPGQKRGLRPSGPPRKTPYLFMDVFRPFPYFAGLLNRMTNPAIAAASLFIRRTNPNLSGVSTPLLPLCH